MKTVLKILSYLGLVLTVIPSFMFLMDLMSLESVKLVMILGGVLWFATAPILQKRGPSPLDHPEYQDNI